MTYYSSTVPDSGRKFFQGLFETFLFQRDARVTRFLPIVCLKGHRLERATVVKRQLENKKFLYCQECGERVDLPEIEKPLVIRAKEPLSDSTGRSIGPFA